jgi:hypothetical protein
MTAPLSVGTIVGNRLDAGYAALSSSESYLKCGQTLPDDPDQRTYRTIRSRSKYRPWNSSSRLGIFFTVSSPS